MRGSVVRIRPPAYQQSPHRGGIIEARLPFYRERDMKPILISVYACLLTIPSFAQDADEAALRASLLHHVGQWEGTYTEIDATDGSVIQRFASLIESRLEGDNFIQHVTHRFSDGREETTEYLAQIENGTLVYPGGSNLHGEVYRVTSGVSVFDGRYRDDPSSRYLESIVINADSKTRVINTFEDGNVKMFTLIVEKRVP
jgi:hypothetical protein